MKRINKHTFGEIGNCINCNEEFTYKRPTQKYCGTSCQMKYEYAHGLRDKNKTVEKAHEKNKQKGLEKFKNNPSIKLGKRGYFLIYLPYEIAGKERGWKKYHHYLWELDGRTIPDGMHLHHINCNKLDNRIENLKLIEPGEHTRLHHKLNTYPQSR